MAEIGAGLRFPQAIEGSPKQTGTDTSIARQREARQRQGDEIERRVADDRKAVSTTAESLPACPSMLPRWRSQ